MSLSVSSHRLESGECTAVQLLQEHWQTLENWEPHVASFLTLDREGAEKAAQDVDARRASGEKLGPLAGIPLAIKDNLCTQGLKTTAASKLLGNFVPPYEATSVARLRAAGAVLVGKTNMDEFGMGSSTEKSAFGPTRNPWDITKVPGGSSGGSASAVAARQVAGALGSDTGGSIRQPAAFCGVTGLKPTYGRVSRYGLIAYGSSLDNVGPLAASARDCAMILEAIAGHDPLDATSAHQPVDPYTATIADLSKGIRLGYCPDLLKELSPDMRGLIEQATTRYQELGCTLVEIDLPSIKHGLAAYYIVAMAEASSNLSRYDGIRYGQRVDGPDIVSMVTRSRSQGFGAEVKRRILLGTYTLSAGYYDAYYHKAQQVRTLIRNEYEAAFAKVDAILMPTTPAPAWGVGEKNQDPIEMYLADIYTVTANLTGLPALALPCGFLGGLPVALQITGPAWKESLLLQLGEAYQAVTDHHLQVPVLFQ